MSRKRLRTSNGPDDVPERIARMNGRVLHMRGAPE